jgi:hypothetical protein
MASLDFDADGNAKLQNKIKNLKILPQRGNLTSSYEQKINGRWFTLNENRMNISRMRLIFNGDEGVWEYENATGHHELKFGIGKIVEGPFPERHYYGERIRKPSGRCYNSLSSAAWVEEHKLNMLVYITDLYLGTLKATFAFKGNEISIFMTKVAEWFLDEYAGFAGGILTEG